jgi:hypothetical protein
MKTLVPIRGNRFSNTDTTHSAVECGRLKQGIAMTDKPDGKRDSAKRLKTIVATGSAVCGIVVMFFAFLQNGPHTWWLVVVGAAVTALSLSAIDPNCTE